MKTKKPKIITKKMQEELDLLKELGITKEKFEKMKEDLENEKDMYEMELMIKCSMGYEDCNPEESFRAKGEMQWFNQNVRTKKPKKKK